MSKTFREILKEKHSKANAVTIKNAVIADPSRIHELMDCFFSEEMRVCQYASWPVGMLGEDHGELLVPYLDKMIAGLDNPKHDAVVRNTLRTWQFMDLPEEYEGPIYDVCFSYLQDMKSPIAFKVFGMTVLTNLAIKYPDLIEELIPAIEDQFAHGSRGFQSRAKNELKRLHKTINSANA